MITKLTAPDDPSINASAEASGLRIYAGPVLPDSLKEIVAVAQNLGANTCAGAGILQIPEDTPVILELAGPATIILAYPAELEPGYEGVGGSG